jgi:putative PIN family toxin of toxin-antitoxin system
MVARKKRTPVVLDTNIFVGAFLSRTKISANNRVMQLWLVERRLQLMVSAEILNEYLEIFERVLGLDGEIVAKWRLRFEDNKRVTMVGLSKRFHESRDPDDNLMLATAYAGRVEYLVTNDKDLLDLPEEIRVRFPFIVCRPSDFLKEWAESAKD